MGEYHNMHNEGQRQTFGSQCSPSICGLLRIELRFDCKLLLHHLAGPEYQFVWCLVLGSMGRE